MKYYLISALLIEAVSAGCCDSHQVHQGQEFLEVAISEKIKTDLSNAGRWLFKWYQIVMHTLNLLISSDSEKCC